MREYSFSRKKENERIYFSSNKKRRKYFPPVKIFPSNKKNTFSNKK